jgi:hypothetical protein
MTPAKIINQSAADGVIISLSVAGKVKATGIQEHVDKWLPTIREYKMSLIAFLSDAETDASENRAEIAVHRNSSILPTVADTDDRRQCSQCLNLRGRACGIAKPERGALVVANVGYRPQPDTPHRCAGYLPNATDNDQRLGGERWPGLTDTKGTK